MSSRRDTRSIVCVCFNRTLEIPQEEVDVEAVKRVFPYGQLLPIEFQAGGMRASSGIELPDLGGGVKDVP